MENSIENISNSIFESIKHIDEDGNEYWYARELMNVLEYKKWQNFHNVIKTAEKSCINSGLEKNERLTEVSKSYESGNGTVRYVKDYKLSRYICYLIAQNSDPRKEIIALAQAYFTIQTRKMELLELNSKDISEDEKRIKSRKRIRISNTLLGKTALKSGVRNFDKFHNYGYKGLYNGETANDIAKRKNLRYNEEILDNMCSGELIANEFRINLTKEALENKNIDNEHDANIEHYNIGKSVRNVIKENGGILPENYPTPKKSIKELNKNKKLIK